MEDFSFLFSFLKENFSYYCYFDYSYLLTARRVDVLVPWSWCDLIFLVSFISICFSCWCFCCLFAKSYVSLYLGLVSGIIIVFHLWFLPSLLKFNIISVLKRLYASTHTILGLLYNLQNYVFFVRIYNIMLSFLILIYNFFFYLFFYG